jgi:hypothetical protein
MPALTWCWRCRADLPMLDELEWEHRTASATAGLGKTTSERFVPALQAYERLTGMAETEGRIHEWKDPG